MSTSHMSRARHLASLMTKDNRRPILLSSCQRSKKSGSETVRSEEEAGNRKLGRYNSIGDYLKTFTKQWKKDLAAIEKRSRARRKRADVKPKTPSSVGKGNKYLAPHFDYLKLEKTKAAEAWNMARENLSARNVINGSRPSLGTKHAEKKVDDKNTVSNRGTFEEFLIGQKGIPNTPAKPKMPVFESDESDEEIDRFRQSYNPPSRGTLTTEKHWEMKFAKARAKRERILENLRNKYKTSHTEQVRLMRLKAFLNKKELEKLDNLRKEYQQKIMKEEMRQRETARILKIVKKIHDDKTE